MDIFYGVLGKSPLLQGISKSEPEKRRIILYNQIFIQTYNAVYKSLLSCDRLIFALRLVQIKLGRVCEGEFIALISSCSLLETSLSGNLLKNKLSLA